MSTSDDKSLVQGNEQSSDAAEAAPPLSVKTIRVGGFAAHSNLNKIIDNVLTSIEDAPIESFDYFNKVKETFANKLDTKIHRSKVTSENIELELQLYDLNLTTKTVMVPPNEETFADNMGIYILYKMLDTLGFKTSPLPGKDMDFSSSLSKSAEDFLIGFSYEISETRPFNGLLSAEKKKGNRDYTLGRNAFRMLILKSICSRKQIHRRFLNDNKVNFTLIEAYTADKLRHDGKLDAVVKSAVRRDEQRFVDCFSILANTLAFKSSQRCSFMDFAIPIGTMIARSHRKKRIDTNKKAKGGANITYFRSVHPTTPKQMPGIRLCEHAIVESFYSKHETIYSLIMRRHKALVDDSELGKNLSELEGLCKRYVQQAWEDREMLVKKLRARYAWTGESSRKKQIELIVKWQKERPDYSSDIFWRFAGGSSVWSPHQLLPTKWKDESGMAFDSAESLAVACLTSRMYPKLREMLENYQAAREKFNLEQRALLPEGSAQR